MKWVVLFFICSPELCSTYVADTRFLNESHCKMMSKQIDPNVIFKLSDKHEIIASSCMPELELTNLTEIVVEDL